MFGDCREQRTMHATLLHNAVQSTQDQRGIAERIADADAITDVETQLTTSDGSIIHVLFSAEVIELEGEQHLLCLYNDITERKRAEQALRFSEEKFRSIVENTKDWVWSTDTEDRLVYSNPALAGMLGYEADELLGSVVMERLHPDQRERVRSEVGRLRVRGEGWTDWLTHWRHKDGSDRYLKSTAVPVFDADGRMTGYRGTDHDLTAIKKFEIELHEAKVRAEQASQAKSEFLANMSHEIRTPMNGVIGMTNLVLRTELSHQQQEYMELIKLSADSLLRLLNDILDFSKMEAKKLELELVEFDLREEMGNVLRTLAASASTGDKDLELALDVGADVPALLVGDNGRLAQVLINLTSNAIKFTMQGEVVLRVAQQSLAQGHNLLHFSVSDTGIGITKEQQVHIFESFVQADASTTRQYGGTGLGLAIVSQIIALMGGELWVESEPGVGTTFHFTARLRLSQREAGAEPAGASYLKGRRVLIADDNHTTRAILGTILRSWDMVPVLAQDATDAIAEMQRAASEGEPYPVMLCDARLHGSSALQVRRAMLAGGSAAGAMIVVCSARDATADIEALRDAGVAEFLHKPVKHSELFVALMKVLRPEAKGDHGTRGAALLPGPGGPPAPRTLRVLVAEDHPINQLLVTELLRGRGHFFAVARNGVEVLQMLERQVFDAILMDGQMPEMDGYQAAAEIRRRETTSGGHIHIVAVTAHAMKDDRDACIAAGMDDYIAKPIEPEQLFATLEKPWMGQAGHEAEGDSANAPPEPLAQVFDVEAALKRTRGKKTLLLQMASAFVADVPRALEELCNVADSADAAAVERSAHRLKGAAATLSGAAVVQAAVDVERLARTSPLELERMQVAVSALADGVATLSAALTNFMSRELK